MLTLREYNIQEGEKALKYHQENPFIYSNNKKIHVDSIYVTEKEKKKVQEYYNNLNELQLIAEGKKIGKTYLYYYLRVYVENQNITNKDREDILKELYSMSSEMFI